MARLQWCRDHIDDVAENCELARTTVVEVKQAAAFCDEHVEFSTLPTKPILTLIRIKDEQVRDRAISSVKKLLNLPKSQETGRFVKSITEKEVKKVIEDIEIEVRNEKIEKEVAETEAEEERTGIKTITPEEVQALLIKNDPGPEKEPEPVINKQGNVIHSEDEVEKIKAEMPKNVIVNTIMQFEIDLYFEIMEKLGCVEDIPKHKKRMELMLKNKTLLVVG
jgi:hypothetical protein